MSDASFPIERRRNRRGTQASNKVETLNSGVANALSARLQKRHSLERRNFLCLVVALSILLLAVVATSFHHLRSQAILQNESVVEHITNTTKSPISRRFPRFGSSEFMHYCNWTKDIGKSPCTILCRPSDHENEGIADWVTKAVSGFISAKLQGCSRFFMDYGLEVDIHQVLVPHSDSLMYHRSWSVPLGYDCRDASEHCSAASFTSQLKKNSGGPAIIPNYRHAFKKSPPLNIYRKNFRHLEGALPGFQLETGMACAMGSLVELSTKASQFEPELFTRILPTLQNERNLVVTLYHRTGQTDKVANAEKHGELQAPMEPESRARKGGEQSAHCAMKLEEEYIFSKQASATFDRVVWLIVSDSPYLKQWIMNTYNTDNIMPPAQNGNRALILPREIITTRARGIHTRTARNPSTRDFAEGMIDWYLIGESDAVITNGVGYTYGTTAAMRTNSTLYNSGSCQEMSFIHEEEPPTWEEYLAMKNEK